MSGESNAGNCDNDESPGFADTVDFSGGCPGFLVVFKCFSTDAEVKSSVRERESMVVSLDINSCSDNPVDSNIKLSPSCRRAVNIACSKLDKPSISWAPSCPLVDPRFVCRGHASSTELQCRLPYSRHAARDICGPLPVSAAWLQGNGSASLLCRSLI